MQPETAEQARSLGRRRSSTWWPTASPSAARSSAAAATWPRRSPSAPGLGAVLSFLLGAATCAILVNHARRQRRQSEYALPLLLEAVFLLGFGLLGARLSRMPALFVPATVMLLCFIMGLQNAVITKLSKAVIQTTHVTGIVTDLGKLVARPLASDVVLDGAAPPP